VSFGRRRLAAFAVCVTLVACRTAAPPNVVLVLVDTLRPDALGCYGQQAGLTPFVDELATRGMRFGHAYAASTWTNPSVASLFTSRWQSQHGVVNLFSVLSDRERTLAEVLHERGFATAGFLATRSIPGTAGFGQGFDVWKETLEAGDLKGAGERVNLGAFAWLDARAADDRRPMLLYLHYMEPHFPYDPRAGRLAAVLASHHFTPAERQAWNERFDAWLAVGLGGGGARPEHADVIRDLYLAEVASLDEVLRELFDGLGARGVLRNAVVVITADHGEEFAEHGSIGHGINLFNDTLHVPVLLLVPGRRPQVVDESVSLLDVAPTLLELVGAPPEPAFEGRSLLRPGPHPLAYAELLLNGSGNEPPQNRALVDGSHKLILTPAGHEQFYDLLRDPGERDPEGLDGDARAVLVRALEATRARAQRDVGTAEQRQIDDATRERLRALGYAN
jgi:choline-sulfatase